MPNQDGASTPELHVCLRYPGSAEFNACCLRPTIEGFLSCSRGKKIPHVGVDLWQIVRLVGTTSSVQTVKPKRLLGLNNHYWVNLDWHNLALSRLWRLCGSLKYDSATPQKFRKIRENNENSNNSELRGSRSVPTLEQLCQTLVVGQEACRSKVKLCL